LRLGGPGKEIFEVEGGRFEALQLRPFGEALQELFDVEVGLGGQRYEGRARGGDLVGEARTGHEPYVVTARDEVFGDGEHRRDVPMGRDTGDDDGRHCALPGLAVSYVVVVFITVSPESILTKTRSYRSELRQQQAEQTRSRIVEAAAELFAADGYARTTLAKIAAAAEVSVETVQAQGPKAALLIAAVEYAAVGVSGEESVLNLDIGRELLAIDDLQEALDFLVTAVTDVNTRTSKLALALFGGATSDPELERYLHDFIAGVNGQARRVLEVFRERGWLRDDVPFDELVETTAVLCTIETYLRITHRDGWSVDAYQAWCRRMLAETVLYRQSSLDNSA
jgi:AcrR family transcriptional regulator